MDTPEQLVPGTFLTDNTYAGDFHTRWRANTSDQLAPGSWNNDLR